MRSVSAHVCSTVLLEELAEVLTRPFAIRQLSAIGKAARDLLPDYIAAIELVEPAELPRVVRDPDDDHVLACALAARADRGNVFRKEGCKGRAGGVMAAYSGSIQRCCKHRRHRAAVYVAGILTPDGAVVVGDMMHLRGCNSHSVS